MDLYIPLSLNGFNMGENVSSGKLATLSFLYLSANLVVLIA